MKIIKNIASVIVFLIAIFIMYVVFSLNTKTALHEITQVCYAILSVLLLIYSYLLGEFQDK